MKIKVLCNVIEHGTVYGRKGDVITVPDAIGAALCKGDLITGPRAEEVKDNTNSKKKV